MIISYVSPRIRSKLLMSRTNWQAKSSKYSAGILLCPTSKTFATKLKGFGYSVRCGGASQPVLERAEIAPYNPAESAGGAIYASQ